MCHWIALSGQATFEEANIQRKQKSIARILAKSIMKFWCSAETLRATSGEMRKEKQAEESIGIGETKLAGINAEKEQVSEINFLTLFLLYILLHATTFSLTRQFKISDLSRQLRIK